MSTSGRLTTCSRPRARPAARRRAGKRDQSCAGGGRRIGDHDPARPQRRGLLAPADPCCAWADSATARSCPRRRQSPPACCGRCCRSSPARRRWQSRGHEARSGTEARMCRRDDRRRSRRRRSRSIAALGGSRRLPPGTLRCRFAAVAPLAFLGQSCILRPNRRLHGHNAGSPSPTWPSPAAARASLYFRNVRHTMNRATSIGPPPLATPAGRAVPANRSRAAFATTDPSRLQRAPCR